MTGIQLTVALLNPKLYYIFHTFIPSCTNCFKIQINVRSNHYTVEQWPLGLPLEIIWYNTMSFINKVLFGFFFVENVSSLYVWPACVFFHNVCVSGSLQCHFYQQTRKSESSAEKRSKDKKLLRSADKKKIKQKAKNNKTLKL